MAEEASPTGSDIDPAPSELGSREYWEKFYGRELANWEARAAADGEGEDSPDDAGDDGRCEIWFGQQAERRILGYVERLLADTSLGADSPAVDVGCGNGHLALQLAGRLGLSRVLCLDYSAPAVQLTQRLAERAGLAHRVTARLLDVTEPGAAAAVAAAVASPLPSPSPLLLLDKGTYDAVSLCPDDSPGKRAAYRRFAAELLALGGTGGRLILASCNWTEPELLAQFSPAEGFAHLATLPGRAFRFGGSVGADVTTVVLALADGAKSG